MKISEVIELLQEIKESKGNIEIGIWKDETGFEEVEKGNMCITEIFDLSFGSRYYTKALVLGKIATEEDDESLYEAEED